MTRSKLVTASFLALMATGPLAARQGPDQAGPPPCTTDRPDTAGLPPEARRVHRYVTTPILGELRWRQIPWLLDLEEGIRRAKAEHRPLLLFVSGDEPLGRC